MIEEVRGLPRFVGSEQEPRQVVRITWCGPPGAELRLGGERVAPTDPITTPAATASDPVRLEIGVAVDAGVPLGSRLAIAAVAEDAAGARERRDGELVVAEPGWRMFMVSHFHYDPVWWNTQAFYTETWEKLPRDERPWEGRRQQPAFTLIDAHLDLARRDPDYRFVLAELDYLKPYWDTFPWRRDELRELLSAGRLELMGGMYNEPNTNLTSAESTVRNAVYGIGYQRDVLGGDPRTAWQLDVFGHDPQFPGMMSDAGLDSSSWARGPFHQWGPSRSPGGNPAMQFASEFDWVSPSGRSLLTSYMPNHYSAGWDFDKAPDLESAMDEAERLFLELQSVAATRNVLLPVGSDYTPPNRWLTAVARTWRDRYVWPRLEVALPREFFQAVRDEVADGAAVTPQTRDMNPVYTGKDVSYIDTKQAQRAGETTLLAAERFGTFASLLGARYPAEALDKAWRQLLFGAHHDGITGTESDQVYLDLLGGWRDTYELASGALDDALASLGARVAPPPAGRPVVVFNALSWDRTDLVRVRIELEEPADGLRLRDDEGADVPFVIEDPEYGANSSLTAVTLTFVASEVPSVGYRRYHLEPATTLPPAATWETLEGADIESDTYRVTVDPTRGGAISSLVDRRSGEELLRADGLANELLAYEEYPTHPDHGEGPWHLTPTGGMTSSATEPATVTRQRSAIGERLQVRSEFAGVVVHQEIALYRGIDRVVCTTDLDGFAGQDTLFRMRVAADVPGGLPLAEVGHAVIGRGAGFPDIDVANCPYTLDNPAFNWFGVGNTARVELVDGAGGPGASRAIAVAEVVGPDAGADLPTVRTLVTALVRAGVTSTVSRGGGTRYGSLDTDSNLPDVRIAVGAVHDNAFIGAVLAAAGTDHRAELERQLARDGAARVWVPAAQPLTDVWRPDADLRDVRALPVLLLVGADPEHLDALLAEVATELETRACIEVGQPVDLHHGESTAATRTVAVLNRGLPGSNVDVHGSLHLSLQRACSGWPSGVWLDPPRRSAPDGSSFQFQHWTHRFEYALVGGDGDWRDLGLVRAGHEHNDPLHPWLGPSTAAAPDGGDAAQVLPSRRSFVRVDGDVVVAAITPAGDPMARMAAPEQDPAAGISIRYYEPHGRHVPDVGLQVWPAVSAAIRTDLLSRPLHELAVADARVMAATLPYAIDTVQVEVEAPGHSSTDVLGRRVEPAQPVFGDYWLHNKGAAPLGYQPLTVRTVERAVAADGPFDLQVSVASQRTDDVATGRIDLVVPDGWEASPSSLHVHLASGGYECIPVRVTPAPGASGRWFVAAQLRTDDAQVHEDVTTVDLGTEAPLLMPPDGERRLLLERATRRAAVEGGTTPPADVVEIGAELTVELEQREIRVATGGTGELAVDLRSRVAGTIRGEAQLISPWGTWQVTCPWTAGFEVAGGSETTVRFQVTCPPGMPPTTSWALVKVMYFGRLHYTDSVPLLLGGAARSPQDRP